MSADSQSSDSHLKVEMASGMQRQAPDGRGFPPLHMGFQPSMSVMGEKFLSYWKPLFNGWFASFSFSPFKTQF